MASLPLETGQATAPAASSRAVDGLEILAPSGYSTPAFVAEWTALAQAASEPNPFYEPWFLLPSQQAFDASGAVRLIAYREGGKLSGVLPLRFHASYYGYPLPHQAGWLHDNAFCGSPLVAKGCEQAFWRALLTHLDASPGGAGFLHLAALPEDGAAYLALREVLLTEKRPAAIVHRHERAQLRSNLSAEAYFETAMTTKKRKELRRQLNRLADHGQLEVARQTDAADVDHWASEYLALERAGWKGRNASALADTDHGHSFFSETLIRSAQAGRLERLTLRLDGAPIAMLANFITPPGAFAFKTGYDERYARFSPGVLLQRENLALLDRAGIDWCDSCAAADHPMIERIWRERRSVLRVSVAIGGTLRRALFAQVLRLENGEPIIGGPA